MLDAGIVAPHAAYGASAIVRVFLKATNCRPFVCLEPLTEANLARGRAVKANRMLKDALRSLKRTPGFVLVVVLTLGLGIGTSVTTFTVLQGVLWKPLPYPNAERLVLLDAEWNGSRHRGVAPLEIRDLKANSRTLDAIAVVSGVPANLEHQRRARTRVRGQRER